LKRGLASFLLLLCLSDTSGHTEQTRPDHLALLLVDKDETCSAGTHRALPLKVASELADRNFINSLNCTRKACLPQIGPGKVIGLLISGNDTKLMGHFCDFSQASNVYIRIGFSFPCAGGGDKQARCFPLSSVCLIFYSGG
jgi:hypothetical protein